MDKFDWEAIVHMRSKLKILDALPTAAGDDSGEAIYQ
jgi:hypothetical protein